LGYYDINALQIVVDRRGYELVFFDARKSLDELPLEDDTVIGILINISTSLLYFFKSRHWSCIRKVSLKGETSSKLYFMDSKQRKPREISIDEAREELSDLRISGAQILLCKLREEQPSPSAT